MNQSERKNRIIARGEHSGHSHIIVGEAEVKRNHNGEILIEVKGDASIKHLLEELWMDGKEVSTDEHTDIDLTGMPAQVRQGDIFLERVADKTYRYIQQQVFDPLTKRIQDARD